MRACLSLALPTALLAGLLALCPGCALAGEPSTNPTSMSFPAGGMIRMELHEGDMEIVGTSEDRITVSWRSSRLEDERQVKANIKGAGPGQAALIVDGPGDRVRYRIEVPARSDLKIQMNAGDLNIHGVSGSVNAELLAGDLDLRVLEPSRYRSVRASVTAGSISAKPWQVESDGLWRSFRATTDSGDYDLRISLLAGQLTLRQE
jgi:hypothetical protein